VREHNPDLPILDELGAEFEALAKAAAGSPAGDRVDRARGGADLDRHGTRRRVAATPTRATRERRSQARRVGRRAAIVLVLVCLVGGVAFAALRGGGSDGRSHTAPAPLGRAADGAWTLSVYRDEGRLCGLFVPRGGELSGRCGIAPGPGAVWAESAIAAGRRYVFGVVGGGVTRIRSSLAEDEVSRGIWRTAVAPARQPIDPGAAGDAGLPAGDRWFVLDLGAAAGSPDHGRAPAVVIPIDDSGHRAGRAYVDCSLGLIGTACKRRIETAAGR
jgi:hypothetical protein